MLYVLLESIDLMLLKLTRRAWKAIGSSEDYLGMADWIVMHRVYIDQTRHITIDKRIGKLSTQCRLSKQHRGCYNDAID